MSGGGGSNTSTTTQTSGPPPQVLQAYQQLNQAAGALAADNQLQLYQGPMVAGFTPQQQSAFSDIANLPNIGTPYLNSAAQEFGAATTPLWPTLPQMDTSGLPGYGDWGLAQGQGQSQAAGGVAAAIPGAAQGFQQNAVGEAAGVTGYGANAPNVVAPYQQTASGFTNGASVTAGNLPGATAPWQTAAGNYAGAAGNTAGNLPGTVAPWQTAAGGNAAAAGATGASLPGSVAPYQGIGTTYNVNQYLSPYTQNVTDALKGLFNNQNATQQQQIAGNATSANAYGGDREAVAQALATQQEQLAQAPTLANVQQQGFQQAQQESNTQQGLGLQAGQLGLAAGQAGGQLQLGAAGAQTGIGNLGLGAGQAAGQLQLGASGATTQAGQLGIGANQAAISGLLGAGQNNLGIGNLGLGANQQAIGAYGTAGQLQLGAGQLGVGADQAAIQGDLGSGQLGLGTGQAGFGEFNTQQQQQLAAEQANAWLESQAGFGMGQLGQEAMNLGLTGANANLSAGAMQQQLAQEQLNIPYQQFEAEQAYPYQQLGFLAPIVEGTGSLSGGIGSTTVPGPSTASQLAGIGLAGTGVLGATGAFGSNGWLTNAFGGGGSALDTGGLYKRGGRTRYASGGMTMESGQPGIGGIGIGGLGMGGVDGGIGSNATTNENGMVSVPLLPPDIGAGVPSITLNYIPQGHGGGTSSPLGLSPFQPDQSVTSTQSGSSGSNVLGDLGAAAGIARLGMMIFAKDGGRLDYDYGGTTTNGSTTTGGGIGSPSNPASPLPKIPKVDIDYIVAPGPAVKGGGPPHAPNVGQQQADDPIRDATKASDALKGMKGIFGGSGSSSSSADTSADAAADAASADLSEHSDYDAGGGVPIGAAISSGGAPPNMQQAYQQLIQMPLEKLMEMQVQFPASTQQGQMIAQAIKMKQVTPGSGTAQAAPMGGAGGNALGSTPQATANSSVASSPQDYGGTAHAMAKGGDTNGPGFVTEDELDPHPVVDHSGRTVKIRYPSEGKVLDLGLPSVRNRRRYAAGGATQPTIQYSNGQWQIAPNGVSIPQLSPNAFGSVLNGIDVNANANSGSTGTVPGSSAPALPQYQPPGTSTANGVLSFPQNTAFTPGMGSLWDAANPGQSANKPVAFGGSPQGPNNNNGGGGSKRGGRLGFSGGGSSGPLFQYLAAPNGVSIPQLSSNAFGSVLNGVDVNANANAGSTGTVPGSSAPALSQYQPPGTSTANGVMSFPQNTAFTPGMGSLWDAANPGQSANKPVAFGGSPQGQNNSSGGGNGGGGGGGGGAPAVTPDMEINANQYFGTSWENLNPQQQQVVTSVISSNFANQGNPGGQPDSSSGGGGKRGGNTRRFYDGGYVGDFIEPPSSPDYVPPHPSRAAKDGIGGAVSPERKGDTKEVSWRDPATSGFDEGGDTSSAPNDDSGLGGSSDTPTYEPVRKYALGDVIANDVGDAWKKITDDSNSVDMQRALGDPAYRKEIVPDITPPGSGLPPASPPEQTPIWSPTNPIGPGTSADEALARGVPLKKVIQERMDRSPPSEQPSPTTVIPDPAAAPSAAPTPTGMYGSGFDQPTAPAPAPVVENPSNLEQGYSTRAPAPQLPTSAQVQGIGKDLFGDVVSGKQQAAAANTPGGIGATQPPAKDWIGVGDSLAGSMIGAGQAHGSHYDINTKKRLGGQDNPWYDASDGRTPTQTLASVKYLLGTNPDYYKGQYIRLSPGTSNDPSQMNTIPEIIKTLKGAGAAGIQLVGVGNTKGQEGGIPYDLNKYNAVLQDMASQNGIGWTGPVHAVVHPNPSFWAMVPADSPQLAPGKGGIGNDQGTGPPDQVIQGGGQRYASPDHNGTTAPVGADSPAAQHVRQAIEALKAKGASPAFIQAALNQPFYEGGWGSSWNPSGIQGENSFGHLQFNAHGELPGYMQWLRMNGYGQDPHNSGLQFSYLADRMNRQVPGILQMNDANKITDILNTQFERYQGNGPGQRRDRLDDAAKLMAGDYSPLAHEGTATHGGGGGGGGGIGGGGGTNYMVGEREIPQAGGGSGGIGATPASYSSSDYNNASPYHHQTAMERFKENWPMLAIATGAGMLASRSPFPGVALGEGLKTGLSQYNTATSQDNKQQLAQIAQERASDLAAYRSQHSEDVRAAQLAKAENLAQTLQYKYDALDARSKTSADGLELKRQIAESNAALAMLKQQTAQAKLEEKKRADEDIARWRNAGGSHAAFINSIMNDPNNPNPPQNIMEAEHQLHAMPPEKLEATIQQEATRRASIEERAFALNPDNMGRSFDLKGAIERNATALRSSMGAASHAAPAAPAASTATSVPTWAMQTPDQHYVGGKPIFTDGKGWFYADHSAVQ